MHLHLTYGENWLKWILVLFAGLNVAYANDGYGPVGIGGIVLGKTDSIAMVSEVLTVSYSKVTVEYEFVNESERPVVSVVSFPLPKYSAFPSAATMEMKGEPHSFSIKVNGASVPYHTSVRATTESADVTDMLKGMGLSDENIAHMPFRIDPTLYENTLDGVLDRAQVAKLGELGLLDRFGYPLWDVNVAYYWQQEFLPHTIVRVEHEYEPAIAMGTAGGAWPDFLRRATSEFCMDPPVAKKLEQLYSSQNNLDGSRLLPGTIVDYILSTASTWKDGIRDFTLRIKKGRRTSWCRSASRATLGRWTR